MAVRWFHSSRCLPGRFAPKTARFARERVPKKIKTFFLRLFFKTFLLASLDGRGDRVSQRCLRGARFARNFFEKSFESLPRMIKSSTRLGVGQFFFSKQRSWWLRSCSSDVPSLCLPGRFAPKNVARNFPKIRKNSRKCTRSHLHRASPGGPHLFWGLHDILFCIRGLT